MIEQLSEFEYLGNSLHKINSNMSQLNTRFDILYNSMEKWIISTAELNNLVNGMNLCSTVVGNTSANWRTASSNVYNLKIFWQEPIHIVYKNVFIRVGNYQEIAYWLNDNFDPSNFIENQPIKCDFMCQNYNPVVLDKTLITNITSVTLEALASTYDVKVYEINSYLSYRNQMMGIIAAINSLFRRNAGSITSIDDWANIGDLTTQIAYNERTNTWSSSSLVNFSETELSMLHSYAIQYNTLSPKYQELIDKGIPLIPDTVMSKFTGQNLDITLIGSFYFRIINGQWTYYPYSGVIAGSNASCLNSRCGDGYDVIDINNVYNNDDQVLPYKYILTDCTVPDPYGDIYGVGDPIYSDNTNLLRELLS